MVKILESSIRPYNEEANADEDLLFDDLAHIDNDATMIDETTNNSKMDLIQNKFKMIKGKMTSKKD